MWCSSRALSTHREIWEIYDKLMGLTRGCLRAERMGICTWRKEEVLGKILEICYCPFLPLCRKKAKGYIFPQMHKLGDFDD